MGGRLSNQGRILLALLEQLGPHLATDRLFPERVRAALADRRFGSRDRRIYRELLYTAFRHWRWWPTLRARGEDAAVGALVWLAEDVPVLAPWRQAFPVPYPPRPDNLQELVRILEVDTNPFPEWWPAEAPEAQQERDQLAVLRRSPMWVRIQAEEGSTLAHFAARQWAVLRSEWAPGALRLAHGNDVTQEVPFLNGWVEVQDVGSQRILAAAPAATGETWLDACAGAGGKTLQLATQVGERGKVVAYEPRASARRELAERAQRSRFASRIDLRQSPPAATELFDGVLVDAPCSGTGTWRRHPHLKEQTLPKDLVAAAARQREILVRYAAHVKPRGRLIYATCSLCRRENQEVVAAFLGAHPEFVLESPSTEAPQGCLYLPGEHDGDGFFAAYLRRR